jgi:methionyl-tRNA formyltransferase
MRLAFLGTPEAAVPSLEALVGAGHDVALVISQPDRRRGRGNDVSASPVKAAALALGLNVADDLAAIEGVEVDLGIVVAYGAMIPAATLARTPMLNVHFSLLPRWRGAAPVERAILAGDEESGVGIISLEISLDTGPLHAERRTDIGEKPSSELTAELAQMGAELLVEVLASPDQLAHPRAQAGESTYAAKLTPDTFHVTTDMTPAQALRVVQLERAFVKVQGRRLRILRAAPCAVAVRTGSLRAEGPVLALGLTGGALELIWVQPEGSRTMSGAGWWAGARLGEDVEWE